MADVDAWLAGTKDLQTWQSGELPAPVIDSLITGDPPGAPGEHPQRGPVPDLPADAVVESICVVDAEGIRGRDQAQAPAPYTEIAAPARGRAGDDGGGGALRRPGAGRGGLRPGSAGRPGRPAPDRRHGGRAAGRDRPLAPAVRARVAATDRDAEAARRRSAGERLHTTRRTAHAARFHRTGGHGPAHDPPPAGGRPPGDGGLAQPRPDRCRRGAGGHRGRFARRRWPRLPRWSSSACPTPPRWWRWWTPCCPPSGRARSVVDCSTIDPDVERVQHARVAATGARYLDGTALGGHGRRREGHAHPDGRRRRAPRWRTSDRRSSPSPA